MNSSRTMLVSILAVLPSNILACFMDSGKRTFRSKISEEYKAQRPEIGDALRQQFPLAKEAAMAFNIACLQRDGFEADDLIATYAKAAGKMGHEVIIVSPDKDLLQVVDSNVKVFDPVRGKIITREDVQLRFGVTPALVPDVQALAGDEADNYKGVPGIGMKTATKLITDHGSLEGLLANLTLVTPASKRKLLETYSADARQCWELAKLREDVPVTTPLEKLAVVEPDKKVLMEFFREQEFKSLTLQMDKEFAAAEFEKALVRGDYEMVTEKSKLEEFVAQITPESVVSFTITTSEEGLEHRPVGVALSIEAGKGIYVPFGHNSMDYSPATAGADVSSSSSSGTSSSEEGVEAGEKETEEPEEETTVPVKKGKKGKAGAKKSAEAEVAEETRVESGKGKNAAAKGKRKTLSETVEKVNKQAAKEAEESSSSSSSDEPYVFPPSDFIATGQLSLADTLSVLKPLMENESVHKTTYDLKRQVKALAKFDVEIKNCDDVMLMSYSVDCGRMNAHDMRGIVKQYILAELEPLKKIVGTGKKEVALAQVGAVHVLPFAVREADAMYRIYQHLAPRLESEGTRNVYDSIELPLVYALADMERRGVLVWVDRNELQEAGVQFQKRLTDLNKEIISLAGHEFNINSTQQLANVLFNEQKIKPPAKKSKAGNFSTGVEVLKKLSEGGHKLPSLILQHRGLAKLHNTYVTGLQQQIHPEDHRVHTCYMNAVTSTGRLSSVNPNLQNIPIRSADGRMIRKAFIAKPDHVLLKADYSQVELRILAHMANVDALLSAFNRGVDVHTHTASQVFNVEYDKVTGDVRQKAKAINFGIIYGMSEFGLAKQLNISREDARDYINKYFQQYPGIKNYMTGTQEFCRSQGYVQTLFGRRCYIPDITSEIATKRQFSERAAINTPIQGTSADITKIVMNKLYPELKAQGFKTAMILQVHDELVFEAPNEEKEAVTPVIKALMESVGEDYKFQVPLIVDIAASPSWLPEKK